VRRLLIHLLVGGGGIPHPVPRATNWGKTGSKGFSLHPREKSLVSPGRKGIRDFGGGGGNCESKKEASSLPKGRLFSNRRLREGKLNSQLVLKKKVTKKLFNIQKGREDSVFTPPSTRKA